MMRRAFAAAALAAAVGLAAAAQTAPPMVYPGFVQGYLEADVLRGVGALPGPPTDPSADRAAYETTRALKDTPRWRQALADAPLDREAPRRVFACALQRDLPEPALALLDRIKTDAGAATGPAKAQYARNRPYVGEATPRTCVTMQPDQANQSYPSGHASIGWAWALVLAELAPDRAPEILARGRAFGESRAVCGLHYPSDVAAGREVAAAAVARLHGDPTFRADLERARAAMAAETPIAGGPGCEREAEGLAASSADAAVRGTPRWLRRPDAADFARVYPREALRKNAPGETAIRCVVDARGRMSDCVLTAEAPTGMGFGNATIKLARHFVMNPTTDTGHSVEGGVVDIPIRWAPFS